MELVLRDAHQALRLLLRYRGFTVAAVSTLALAIGSCTATFSIISFALLNPISCDQPDRLVALDNALLTRRGDFSPGPILDWKEELQSFEDLAAYSDYNGGSNLSGAGEPDRVQSVEVSVNFFNVLGVSPALGRTFAAEEEISGRNRVAVISAALWKRRFGASSEVVGRTILLNTVPFTIVGVCPQGFRPPARADLWIPISIGSDRVLTSPAIDYNVIGRLKPGFSPDQAGTEIAALKERFKRERSDTWLAHRDLKVISLIERITGNVRASLLVLAGAVVLVMLIACANVANLLLSRASMRRKEIAVRAALGASRWQIVRQLLIESLSLSCSAGVLGLLVASALLANLGRFTAEDSGATIDLRALLFTLGASLLTGLLAGLAPAIHASKVDLNESLKQGAAETTRDSLKTPWRRLFVISEVALALVLLSGTGLLIKSLIRLQKVDSGIDPTNVLTVSIDLPRVRYPASRATQGVYDQILARIASIPGVRHVAAINALPFSDTDAIGLLFDVVGEVRSEKFQDRFATNLVVTPDYFRAMGIPLLKGRAFSEQDGEISPRVLIVNQSFAKRYWPNEDSIGKRLQIAGEPAPNEIIGVVGDVKHFGLEGKSFLEMYRTYRQATSSLTGFVCRTEGDPARFVHTVQAEIQELDQDLPLYDTKTMEQRLGESMSQRKLILLVLGTFASIAVVLAVGGTYSVVSYSTSQRNREIGIRMALGAERSDIIRLVIKSGIILTAIGVTVGVGCSIALTRLMSTLLFDLEPTDPGTLAITALSLSAVAALACLVPTYRATKVDPVTTLRCE
jgi:putative ABC transport system permease protein